MGIQAKLDKVNKGLTVGKRISSVASAIANNLAGTKWAQDQKVKNFLNYIPVVHQLVDTAAKAGGIVSDLGLAAQETSQEISKTKRRLQKK